MSDDWDDWDDGETQVDEASSDGWDWPAEDEGKSSGMSASTSHGARQGLRTSSGRSSRRVSDDEGVKKERRELEDAEGEARFAREVEDLTDRFFAELGKYLEDIADPSVRENINKELERHSFSHLKGYYDGKANLAAYTIDTELQRMRYEIIDEDGSRVAGDDKELARAFLATRQRHPIVRMANQSIFADMLQALQGCLLRPELEISVISRECEFSLDFSRGVLEAASLFAVSTVGGGCGAGAGDDDTLEIAHVRGTARVDNQSETYRQRLLTPQLRMVFDDHMRASAAVLARHALANGDAHGVGVGAGEGRAGWTAKGPSSLEGMSGALRQSLVRAGTDGMVRAASAGTGLLANVVATVGTAIGAAKKASDEDDPYGLRSLSSDVRHCRNDSRGALNSGVAKQPSGACRGGKEGRSGRAR